MLSQRRKSSSFWPKILPSLGPSRTGLPYFGVAVGVIVGVSVGVGAPGTRVLVGVAVVVSVGVALGVKVAVGTGVAVSVEVGVGVNVAVLVAVGVTVGVGVGVGGSMAREICSAPRWTEGHNSATPRTNPITRMAARLICKKGTGFALR